MIQKDKNSNYKYFFKSKYLIILYTYYSNFILNFKIYFII